MKSLPLVLHRDNMSIIDKRKTKESVIDSTFFDAALDSDDDDGLLCAVEI